MWKLLCYGVSFVFGSLMLFGGAFVLHSMPGLFEDKIKANLPLLKGTDAYNRFTTPSAALSIKVYLFNVTNPHEVQYQGARPQLAQVGPYSLSERRKKHVIATSPDGYTLDYKLYRTFFFNETESAPLDAQVTLINLPAFSALFAAAEKQRNEEALADPLLVMGDYLANESLYITKRADEWLFKGVKLDWLEKFDQEVAPEGFEPPPDYTFGLYYKKNDTWDAKEDGVMTVSTGVDGNFANIGKVLRWNNKNHLAAWKDHCNQLRGTDGQFFHPFLQKDELLEIFVPDLCRSLTIQFIKTTSIRSIELYRFGLAESFFKPINADNSTSCYCVKHSTHEAAAFCSLSGVVDVSSCRKKPVVLSTPHFYNGDPRLRKMVDGMNPSAANHDTFLDIEPMSGTVLRVKRRMQLNAEIGPIKQFSPSSQLKEKFIHPFIWMDQSITVPDDIAQKLENKLTKMVRMVRILCYAAIITGPIILIATLIFICRDIRSEDKKIRNVQKNKKGGSQGKNASANYQKIQLILTSQQNNRISSGNNDNTGGDSANNTMTHG